jgi:hypothetical protein
MLRYGGYVVLTALLSVSVAVNPGISFADSTGDRYVHEYGTDAMKLMHKTTYDNSGVTDDTSAASSLSSDAMAAVSCTSHHILARKRKQLRDFLDASMERISQIHRRELLEMTGPNQHAIAWAENVLSEVQRAVYTLRTRPLVDSVDVWAPRQQLIGRTKLSVHEYTRKVPDP